jgi:hypothetical protein
LTAGLKVSAAKNEAAKTTIAVPPFNEEFREQRKREPTATGDANKKKGGAYNIHHWRQPPPTAVEAWCFHPELLRPKSVEIVAD